MKNQNEGLKIKHRALTDPVHREPVRQYQWQENTGCTSVKVPHPG